MGWMKVVNVWRAVRCAACGVLFFSWHVQLLVLSKH
jgi:hypothetical protein